ncbi:probable pectinesterase/pectinesterase inhibitor 13 [Triticum dicoccoides]|uniref:probable pectinesterase/pectinesterase inhibitor 13 n=1 Tax=Triticum dicoccoides TaxID=85692 RepID=UPI00188DCA42|nr:probable pectinesterase/pectinesterase inhibitor 13 [Triticum dicoccoides]
MAMPRSAPAEPDESASRTKLLVGGIAAFLLLAIIIGTAAFIVSERAEDEGDTDKKAMAATMRTVDLFCSPTDYQATCKETLTKPLERSNNQVDHPHAAAAAAITAVGRELARGFNESSLLEAVRQSNDTLVHEALLDCKMLLDDCANDVTRALSTVAWRGVDGPAQDLQAWLSAVITFQGSCVDMFPKGDVRVQIKEIMEKAREISSNAIAIIQQGAALAAMLEIDAGAEVTLAKDADDDDDDKDDNDDTPAEQSDGERQLQESMSDVPTWVPSEDRRILEEAEEERNGVLTPNVTVAKDGSGAFTNISAALDALPKNYSGRYVIYIKEAVDGDRFMAVKMGIRNTAGDEKQQAIAVRVKGDRAVFFNCRIDGHQDTLFAQAYRQYYRSCIVSGTVDFIFGDAAAVFQRCVLLVKDPLPGKPGVVTAHGRRDRQQTTGFVLHRTRIVADEALASKSSTVKTFLGRPWKEFSRVVVIESVIDGFVHAQGYMPWEGKNNLGTAFYGEYANVGDGANITAREEMKGFHVLNKEKSKVFTVERFLNGGEWIPETGTPVRLGLFG